MLLGRTLRANNLGVTSVKVSLRNSLAHELGKL